MAEIHLFDVVALTEDIPDEGLRRGQVGTVIDVWEPNAFEVEFSDLNGITYAMLPLHPEQLMVLHYVPERTT
jgi:hypothetical protein